MPSVTAHIREPSGLRRRRWPFTVGLPCARGDLRDPTRIALLGRDGQPLPCVGTPLAVWPDGSIRWLLLDGQVDLEPMEEADLTLQFGGETDPVPFDSPLNQSVRPDHVDISTGKLSVRLARRGARLIESISRGRREFLAPGEEGELTALDADGRGYRTRVDQVELEEANPLRLVVLARGGYVADDGAPLCSWLVRLYFYAGREFFKLYHTLLHDGPDEFLRLRRLRLSLPLNMDGERRASLGARSAWFGHGFEFSPLTSPISLVQWNPERIALFADGRSDHRANGHGWIHLADSRAGVTLKLRRPWQNYPKRLASDGDRFDLDLYPDLSDFTLPQEEPGRNWTEIDPPEGVLYDAPLRVPQGMAKTHELFLHFGPALADARAVDALCLAFEQPLRPLFPSAHYATSGALGPFPPFRDEYWPLELKLRQFCQTPNGRGLLDSGDQVHLGWEAGRRRTLTTENLAYELPRSILRQYLRSGDQRLFWEGEATVMHLMDVDTVHFSEDHPEWVGGPYFEWSQNHHFATTDEDRLSGPQTSHTWLGGLLDYYFLTGYRRAREVAEACADFCRRNAPYHWKRELTPERVASVLEEAEEWPFSTRVAGWPLVAMGTFHDAFPDDRFLRAMEALVDLFEVWQDDEGRWRDRIGSFNRGATPFMDASVLQGLLLYHRATGDERARQLLLRGVRFLVDRGRTPEGIFYYKESPISTTPHASTAMLLGPLAFAYEQTGEPDILDAGYRLFRWLVDNGSVATYMLEDLFRFIPLLERLELLDDYRGRDIRAHLERLEKKGGTPAPPPAED